MKKEIYWKTHKRKFKNGGVKYAHWFYVPFPGYDYSWLEGVEIRFEIRGSEPGTGDLFEVYYKPTYTEAKLIGAGNHVEHSIFIPMRSIKDWENGYE